jgi:hypothetical protein
MILPFDSESSYAGLLSKNIASNTLDNRLGRRLRGQFLRVVLIVIVVANADELTAIVTAGEKDDSDTENLRGRDAFQIGRISLEDEFVHTDWDRANKEGVEFLVILGAMGC